MVQEEGRWNPSVADPDLQIRGGGGGGHPDPEISRGAQSPKKFFRLFGPHFDRKIRGGRAPRAPPLDPPLPLPTVFDMLQYFEAILPSLKSF